jgi:aminoglycoside phosphotransferase (APT) family kinase protein
MTDAIPPHGFANDPRSLWLRKRPPASALRWVQDVLQVDVTGVRAYRGGSSSAIHGIRVLDAAGPRTVVLRRYVDARVTQEEPDIVLREAAVLATLNRIDLPTPAPLSADAYGESADVPALLMARVRGHVEWHPTDLESWLRRLAMVLPPVHEVTIEPSNQLKPFVPYDPESWDPPDWLRDKRLWDRALAFFQGPRLDDDSVLIHRDFHPGNVLWARGRVSGVVDWQAACVGPRAADVWHCRGNLLGRFGLQVADRFVALWEEVSGQTYNPWAETVMLVDAMGWLGPRGAERYELERLVARRLAEFGA